MARRLTTNQEIPGSTPGVFIFLPFWRLYGIALLLAIMHVFLLFNLTPCALTKWD